jgi:hypothetical protein
VPACIPPAPGDFRNGNEKNSTYHSLCGCFNRIDYFNDTRSFNSSPDGGGFYLGFSPLKAGQNGVYAALIENDSHGDNI